MSNTSKGYIFNSVCLAVCCAMMATGLSLFVPGSQSSITDGEASYVCGGVVGFSIGNANCPASTFCNQTKCTGGVCPTNTKQFTQVNQTFPGALGRGGPEKGWKFKQFLCRNIQACANPCLISTTTGTAYCSGPVGPVSPGMNMGFETTGPKGEEKSKPKDDKDVDEGGPG